MNNLKSININELKEVESPNIIDIREPEELYVGTIENSRNIPTMGLLMNASNFLDKDKEYYIYCASGNRSMQVCSHLTNDGYNVVNLEGGYSGYHN